MDEKLRIAHDELEKQVQERTAELKKINKTLYSEITERKKAEETIKDSERRLWEIIDNAPFGAHIYELHQDGRLVFTGANRSADRILGIDHKQFINKTIEEAFLNLSRQKYQQLIAMWQKVENIMKPNRMATFFRDSILGDFRDRLGENRWKKLFFIDC